MPYRPKPSKAPRRGADAYLSPAKKTGVARGTFKSGGLYSSGRAITIAPGSQKAKPRPKFRDSDTRLGKTTSAKDRNMARAQQRGRVTSAMPSKGPNKNTNKKIK